MCKALLADSSLELLIYTQYMFTSTNTVVCVYRLREIELYSMEVTTVRTQHALCISLAHVVEYPVAPVHVIHYPVGPLRVVLVVRVSYRSPHVQQFALGLFAGSFSLLCLL